MIQFNPPYLGNMIKNDILLELSIRTTKAAIQVGVPHVTLSHMVNRKAWLKNPTPDN